MTLRYARIGFILCLVAITVGCAGNIKPGAAGPSTKSPSDSEDIKNQELSYGYGQLYKTVSGLKHLKTMLKVKVESGKINTLIEDISGHADKLAGQLEKLNREYPALRIDNPGLPDLETKRRKAVVWDQVFVMAPIVGKTGKDFERTLLLSQAGVLNNLRFLAQVIKDAEKSNQRKTFLAEAQTRLDDLYQRVVHLLEQEYFC
jgi:hypothetical protein